VERRPWRTLDADLLRFTTTDLRELHLAIMTAFEESAVLAPALNLDQVRSSVAAVGWDDPIEDDVLHRAMAALTGWGLLEATQDHSARYATPEEFERKNLQWSLTPRGEAAIGPTVRRLSERVGERVHAAQASLGARVDFDRELANEGWSILRTVANGMRRHVTELAAALGTELAEGRAELAEEEERLFEQTLAGSVRRALADRIRQANALADSNNDQLAGIRSVAGGVQVRLRWEVDPEQPDAVKAARSLLLRDPADLSDGERSSLQEFVRARVDQARAELEANAPWEARLRETLDYRVWHRFTLQLAHRDWEGFVPATPRRLQELSTGERSIALHLPMIASVAAHYVGDKGRPSCCPRLILLDELFAGVDTANRAQLFGTFSTWDLDAVFTSDHEWCQYGSLDGIAIHHLHPPTGDEPVTSTRFTWDGRTRRAGPSAA
jgi:hypothetical protein